MAIGRDIPTSEEAPEVQAGSSAGVPARGELEGSAYQPLGNPGIQHWQASFISEPGLNERGNVFFAAIEMTRMPMLVVDARQPDWPVVFANKAFLDLTQYAEADVLGRNCRFLQGPQTDAATVEEVRTALQEQRAVAVDILNYKADGRPFWNALFIGPVFGEDGELLYWFSSQMDITERRMSEQSLLQAQKMEAIGQLTAGLAHDFNNLLQVIVGNLEAARVHARDNAALGIALERALQASHKGGRLTQQLLTFARKQRLDPRPLNLNALVLECSDMLVRTLGDWVVLRMDLQPGLPPCTVDPHHLEMALLNVLINARDASPSGGRVTLSTSMRHQQGPALRMPGSFDAEVMIEIADQGDGMPPEVLRRASEPFFTTKGFGTGLGLAMVHGFVQQSHGRLELDSEPGRGTRVRMYFPAAKKAGRDNGGSGESAGNRSLPPEPAEAQDGPPCTVLLVEDSDDVREIACACLESAGIRTHAAASGEEALQVLDSGEPIDLLFTDVIMPGGMNGLQLAQTVQQRRPELPVLLTTGYMDELSAKAGDRERLPVLAKPYRCDDMLSAIRKIVSTAPRK